MSQPDSPIQPDNFLPSFKLIQEQLFNDDYYNETMEAYLKIKKHSKLYKFKLLTVEPVENDTATFSFSLYNPDKNGIYHPWVSLYLCFNDIVYAGDTSYIVQIYHGIEPNAGIYSSIPYKTLSDALDRCAIELDKRSKNEIN